MIGAITPIAIFVSLAIPELLGEGFDVGVGLAIFVTLAKLRLLGTELDGVIVFVVIAAAPKLDGEGLGVEVWLAIDAVCPGAEPPTWRLLVLSLSDRRLIISLSLLCHRTCMTSACMIDKV